ncbi:MATE family efflux transporter [Dinghuibacter silviterrae]|uniref:Multidrug-efflux transporter n=1 Tax=Dinghuibacter silviterrae TaxID=1539049 RepID=A0A4R8DJ16_9BACT|nr:MATE family efflux transporter [Dinghuibacter silviterrae]TDW97575.1 putative MATE family efflux protein [Dinghuibacter silviterrae]
MDLRLNISNRQILSIALPISMAMIIPQINFITNNIFLGMLGERELGTAGITGVYYLVVAVIGNGLNNGLQSIISRRAGENNIAAIGRTYTQGLRLALVFALGGIVLTYLVTPHLMHFFLHSPDVASEAVSFLLIRVWGLPFLFCYQMSNAFMVGTNHSRFLVIGTLCETTVNVFLDYSLINGHFGLPALGFNGAAYASIAAECTGMCVMLGCIAFKGLHRRFYLLRQLRLDLPLIKVIARQSMPLVLQYSMSLLSWLYFYTLIEHHGTLGLAVSNTLRNIIGLFGVFSWAFASTTNTMVSNVIGQGLLPKVQPLIRRIMWLSLGFCICIALILNLFPRAFLSIYGQDAAFVHVAIPLLRMVTGSLCLMAVANVWLNAVTGTGKTRINLAIEIVAIVAYLVYVYLVLERFNLGLVWAWGSEYLYWLILGVLAFVYIRSGKWKYR